MIFRNSYSISTFVPIIRMHFYTTFLIQPFLGGGEFTNQVTGKIKLANQTLCTIDGHWDEKVMVKDKKNGVRFL